MRISSVVLTKNSATTLDTTLSSLSFCDEIIVIDDGSTDGTEGIARKHDVIFFSHDLGGDFASQRNFGLSKAKGDWILFVDSDEVISKELADEIRTKCVANKSGNGPQGFYLKRKDVIWGTMLRHGETAHVRLLRLARKDAGVWVRSIHEVWNVSGGTECLEHPIVHYPHESVGAFLSDINRYSTMNAREFYREGVRVTYIQIIAYPLGKFIQNYFFRLGFLDGMPGLIVTLMMSFHSFLTRGKLWELQRKNQI